MFREDGERMSRRQEDRRDGIEHQNEVKRLLDRLRDLPEDVGLINEFSLHCELSNVDTPFHRWLARRAHGGDSYAQEFMGALDIDTECPRGYPHVVEELNDHTPEQWYQMSASQGNPLARIRLSASGDGEACREGAERGILVAQHCMGVPLVPTEGAVRWFKMGADRGYLPSLLSLVKVYRERARRSRSPEDFAEALRWCRRVIDLGDPEGRIHLRGVVGDMTKDDALQDVLVSRFLAHSPKR